MRILRPCAVSPENSRGRRIPDTPPEYRTEFQRDRDRIVHSTAFRRLEYKTQVFVNHEGDLFRTRLTHTIEVAQIARAIARALGLNEDLVEAISLAHDLGHTPFGHAGQDALNTCMKPFGGFEHNLQSLRIVDTLEERYVAFSGLNLCFETREGIVKHCSPNHAKQIGDVGERFLARQQPSLEAQLCNIADEIAYNNHDIDDGVRAGLISLEALDEVKLFEMHSQAVKACYSALTQRQLIHETIRRMINALAVDLIETSTKNLDLHAPQTPDEVRCAEPLVTFSQGMKEAMREMKRFLHETVYRHYTVLRMTHKAETIISSLFDAFTQDPRLLPPKYRSTENQERRIADYIAGMTDRYAIREYRRLFSIEAS